MFGWFKSKPRWVDEPDEVYQTRAQADVALVRAAKAATLPVIVASFFPASLEKLEAALSAAGVNVTRLSFGSGVNYGSTSGVLTLDASRLAHEYGFDGWLLGSGKEFTFLFVEHHPLPSVERVFLDVLDGVSKLKVQRVRFFVGLDEPLMRAFGGDRIIGLMTQLGMKPDEVIQHPMVDRSIENAQKKLEKAAKNALSTRSVEEWFAQNLRK
jgi:hypothetical protein